MSLCVNSRLTPLKEKTVLVGANREWYENTEHRPMVVLTEIADLLEESDQIVKEIKDYLGLAENKSNCMITS